MRFKVRFRPKNTPDYPELTVVIDVEITVPKVNDPTEQERLDVLEAARYIREKFINNDIIGIEKLY